jgi:hypothetical protein
LASDAVVVSRPSRLSLGERGKKEESSSLTLSSLSVDARIRFQVHPHYISLSLEFLIQFHYARDERIDFLKED